jgi:hypothetical protein
MKNTNSIVKIPLVVGLFFFTFLGSNILTAKPAQALTWPEVGKLFGVWSRYIDDIERTMYDRPQPRPQPTRTPTIQQKTPTPQPSNDEELEERLKELNN